jgi:hypothetical protein
MGGINYVPEPDEIFISPMDAVTKKFTLRPHIGIILDLKLLFIGY